MTRTHRRTTDERAYGAAVFPNAPDGGLTLGPPLPGGRESAMAELGIFFDGSQYEYNGYRYDDLDDAVACAKLIRSWPTQLDAWGSFVLPPRFAAPSDAQRTLMSALAITFDGRAYHFEGFRCEDLADAVIYARLARSSAETVSPSVRRRMRAGACRVGCLYLSAAWLPGLPIMTRE